MTPETQAFLLALSDRWLPFLTILAGIVTMYLKLRSVEKGINGRMTELVNAQAGRAHAEGKIEGIKEAPLPPPSVVVVPPVVNPLPPTRTGQERTRATDRPPDPPPGEPRPLGPLD